MKARANKLDSKPVSHGELIQQVWGGYGDVRRVGPSTATGAGAVVKTIRLPAPGSSDRESISFQRKLSSYFNEVVFYSQVSKEMSQRLSVPRLLDSSSSDSVIQLVLSDLKCDGYQRRASGWSGAVPCLRWLACFHASFMVDDSKGGEDTRPKSVHALWPVGTYWHLGTRLEEFDSLERSNPLRGAAKTFEDRLSSCEFHCLVHGDAKFDNFLLDESGQTAAAVDFQYVGHGCGMKDVAYLVQYLDNGTNSLKAISDALDVYFGALRTELERVGWEGVRVKELERMWRELFPVAVADFMRFYCGWAGMKFADISEAWKSLISQAL